MGRTKDRDRKAVRMETLEILRERDRKLSAFDRLLPPDSNATPPTRILRSNIDSCRLPTDSPPAQALLSDTGSQRISARPPPRKKLRRLQKQADQIAERARLMSTRSTDVLDLTNIEPDIDTNAFAKDITSSVSQSHWRNLNVFLCVGFSGYSERTNGQCKPVPIQTLQSPPSLQLFIQQMLEFRLQVMGLQKQDIEISGYEVLFPADCIYDEVAIQADQRVLVRSSNILVGWAHQAMNHRSTQLQELVVRIVKKDGTMFDTTFRTQREITARPIRLSDSIEPGTQDGPYQAKSMPKVLKRRRHRAGREANGKSSRKEDDTLTRRENLARKAAQRLDMTLLESMMAGQHISGKNMNHSVSPAADLPDHVPQQSDKAGCTKHDLEDVEQGLRDLEMT